MRLAAYESFCNGGTVGLTSLCARQYSAMQKYQVHRLPMHRLSA